MNQRICCYLLLTFYFWTGNYAAKAQQLMTAGKPAQLIIRKITDNAVRITLKPINYKRDYPYSPAVTDRKYFPAVSLSSLNGSVKKKIGNLYVTIKPSPLSVTVANSEDQLIQKLVFNEDRTVNFALDGQPVLGMGEGGHKTPAGTNWRTQTIEFDRAGRLQEMEPRWQSDAYGSRNPVPLLIGTSGWGLFVSSPWVQVDMRNKNHGIFMPWQPTAQDSVQQTEKNQNLQTSKGLPPATSIIPGLFDIFVFDAHDPATLMKDIAFISGAAVMPPKWALGYMQSHRTLHDEAQMLGIVDTFREKKIPLDAVIYLGTGFTPRGWNTLQPSFDFNPEVFHRDPKVVLNDFHAKHVKVVLHMVPWDRDKLPGLEGSIPAKPGETVDAAHIQNYWIQHIPLVNAGVDAFWPDEGDWFNLFERIKRHQLYYEGPLLTTPNVRPWSLHRNGYLGIAQWGGWVWSGDTESSWKTLEGQIAVGINYSLSISPYWGSDIGGFYASREKTGELYARWYQFGAFCPSFRSHGRTWHTSLPWGWGLDDMGVSEGNNSNTNSRNGVQQSEMNNPLIEPVIKKFDELRYQLLPYNYTLAWQAHETGMPLMRALWLAYPNDEKARAMGNEYLWGSAMLIAPVYEKGATSRDVYLPEDKWYDWWTNKPEQGGKTIKRDVDLSIIPIYIKAGAIIPFDPVRQYSAEHVNEPTTIKVYRGANGKFILYEDDGISLGYLKGKFNLVNFSWNDHIKHLTIKPGNYKEKPTLPIHQKFKILLLPDNVVKEVSYDNKRVTVSF